MGLSVTVGMVAMFERIGESEGAADYRERLDRLASELERAGVSGYREPAHVPSTMRAHCASFPYSMLHYLRRCYALLCEDMPITPTDDPDADLDVVEDASSMMGSHLLCHSDADGYYVPVDFEEPIFLEESSQLVGSSQRLLAEL